MGMSLLVNEFIFNAFLVLVLGSFAIGSIDKYTNKKHGSKDEPTDEPEA
jgi:hypothetical protein